MRNDACWHICDTVLPYLERPDRRQKRTCRGTTPLLPVGEGGRGAIGWGGAELL